jgi:hypothetical protein
MMLRRVAENCERLGLHRSRRPGRPRLGGRARLARNCGPENHCGALRRWADEGVRPHVNSLVEFTIDSIEQEDARGLVKIDQIFAEDSE